jgi:phenylacetate-CoA ligase
MERYVRVHQTSGTTGQRLRWLDTEDSWRWFGRCWTEVYRGAGVGPGERIFFAFSFGPFVGFWSAHEGASQLGAMSIPGGGMSSLQRLEALQATDATVLVCTPTYALHLAAVAREAGMNLADSTVHTTIHAGEPGASLPATRARIEEAWGARCYDHAGATEVGAWGFECQQQDGLHLNEAEFLCEIVDPDSGQPATDGELVITNLGRTGMPVIRYRTGDHVRWHRSESCACGRPGRKLDGGVIGRLDDALLVRGVNIYPSAIENIVRRFSEVTEFAVHVRRPQAMDELEIHVELPTADDGRVTAALAAEVHRELSLRPSVVTAATGSLPRFELKARRVTDHRESP